MTREERILAQREQITYWLEYFKDNKMEHGDLELQDKLKDFITSMLGMQLDEMGISLDDVDVAIVSDEDIGYLGGYLHNTFVKDGTLTFDEKPYYEFNLYTFLYLLEDEDTYYRLKAIKDLSRAIFHEARHHRQHLMIDKNVSSKETIMFAREFLLEGYMGEEFYEENYTTFVTEGDANIASNKEYKEILDRDETNSRDIFLKWDDKKTSIIDTAILEDPMCLLLFPVLQKQYNITYGTRKSPSELIKNMKLELQSLSNSNELTDEEKRNTVEACKEMYYELIYQALERASIEQLEELKNINGVKNIIEDIISYFKVELANELELRQKEAEIFSNEYNSDFLAKVKFDVQKREVKNYYNKRCKTLTKLSEELFEQEKSIEEPSDVLKSAIMATEEGTRTGEINQQLQCMMELEENKDKEQEKVGIER